MSGALEIAHPSHPNSYAAPSTDSDSDASSSTSNAVHTPNSLASMASPPPADGAVNGAARPLPHRKNSSPLMPPFMVSAPGKVIVYGEHAVVHGKAAIAAAISLRSYLLVTFLSKSKRTVSLRFPDIDLNHTWNIDDLPWPVFSAPDKKKYYYDLVTALDPELVDSLQPHIKAVSPDQPEHIRKIHQASASAFLYLFLSLGSQRSAPCIYTLRSTIPIGAGLGSSASIAVCLAAALLLQIRALSGPHPDQPSQESELQIERINRWAFVGEMCIHGNPSGVDNTVSSGGKAVLFQRTDYSKPPTVTPLRDFPELPLLLVNTRQSRSTATEVAKVQHLKNAHPLIAEQLLSAINDVTESAHRLISAEDFDPQDPAALHHLGDLITINHGLLVSLGVSHPKLERIRALIDHAGIGWTKLTGAGGGGCAITILKPEASSRPVSRHNSVSVENGLDLKAGRKSKTLVDLEQKLVAEGFEKFETTLAGDGVGVLWPAVLHNVSGEEGGEEIDQEKFLKAEGNPGIEKLVGVNMALPDGEGNAEYREGWRFWRP
ncbi:putative mevalonate kinase protein [Lasiodiplodia theobromae]|uniref:Mevalonate kinase n=2 Tax=Lasiodiplodia TaxID=66739 RepID=A0A5N5DL52_9PEZI|nr:Mevalonate kinase [Lasiodiplodia theobromae]KAB2578615.1 Mevalonate kinase [Lasiodiplodia theobromae]KAF4538534.1 Mevalonate kinase [Lasiodiplodia theobromae]KAF9640614.1 putative mevalonate kinase protein [Lasiodiplodia theobromae]KAK0659342.1 Mevalonate kinase [Lasiodiplodia hormozganensis]